jgi:hypothetical protein
MQYGFLVHLSGETKSGKFIAYELIVDSNGKVVDQQSLIYTMVYAKITEEVVTVKGHGGNPNTGKLPLILEVYIFLINVTSGIYFMPKTKKNITLHEHIS